MGLVTALPLGGCVTSGKFFLFLWKMTRSDEKQARARRLEYQMVPGIVFQETPFDIHYRRGNSGFGLLFGALPHLFQVNHRAGGIWMPTNTCKTVSTVVTGESLVEVTVEKFPQIQAEASSTEAQSREGVSARLGALRQTGSECGRNSLQPRGLRGGRAPPLSSSC